VAVCLAVASCTTVVSLVSVEAIVSTITKRVCYQEEEER
jgi:hypothetical protein